MMGLGLKYFTSVNCHWFTGVNHQFTGVQVVNCKFTVDYTEFNKKKGVTSTVYSTVMRIGAVKLKLSTCQV